MDTGLKGCEGPELQAKYSQLDHKGERARAPPSSRTPPIPPHFNNNIFCCCLVYVFENSHFLCPGFPKLPHYIGFFLMESPLKWPRFLSSPVVQLSASQNEFLLSYFFFQSRENTENISLVSLWKCRRDFCFESGP